MARFTFNNLVEVEVRKEIYETAEEVIFFPSFVSFRAGSNNKYINTRFLCLFALFLSFSHPLEFAWETERSTKRKFIIIPFFAFPLCLIPRFCYTLVSFLIYTRVYWIGRDVSRREKKRERSPSFPDSEFITREVPPKERSNLHRYRPNKRFHFYPVSRLFLLNLI